MRSKLALLVGFFLVTPIFLLYLIIFQLFIYHQNYHPNITAPVQVRVIKQDAIAINAVTKKRVEPIDAESVVPPVTVEKPIIKNVKDEPRVAILKQFLGKYNSPLEGYSQAIVDAADNYGLDWRLLPAIAMQESTLCKRVPKDSNNCWGFGIYGGKVTRFSDYGEAINVITKALARDYHAYGMEDPNEMVKKYTPANTNDWAGNVSYIMGRISPSIKPI